MSSAMLVENKLHHEYWRKAVKPTIAVTGATEQAGYEFVNCIDENGGTAFKVSGGQAVITITFDSQKLLNGFAIFGHNLKFNQGIQVKFSTALTGDFFDFKATNAAEIGVYNSEPVYNPSDNSYKAFGCAFKQTFFLVRRLQITTVGWDSESYISILSAGLWVNQGIDISAPFVPPMFAPQETVMKRNNKGNPLLSDVRAMPQKLKINMTQFSEDDLLLQIDNYKQVGSGLLDYTKSTINGETKNFPLVELVGHYVSRYPFFLMYMQGTDGETDAQIKADRDKIYYCTVDKSLKQPSYSSPTLLNWSINAIGYIS